MSNPLFEKKHKNYSGNDYPYFIVPRDQWLKFSGLSKLKAFLVRGFYRGGRIYIKEGTKIGLNKLIVHEIGHELGYKHTWLPFLNNPSWLFRWINRFLDNRSESSA